MAVKKLTSADSDMAWALLLTAMKEKDYYYQSTRLRTPAEFAEMKKYSDLRAKIVAAFATGLQLGTLDPAKIPALVGHGFTP